MSGTHSKTRIYNRQFWLVCTSSLLFFASFNMIIPELPAFLSSLGGGDHKGLIISLFTCTALISRPFSGKLADRVGRVPVMMFGSVVCLLCSFVYPFVTGIWGFFLLRLAHGFSTGFTPTGQTAYLSDIVPANRRGEAMGLLGTAGAVGMAAGPAAGGLIANAYGIDYMFYCSSLSGFLSIVIMMNVRETLPATSRFSRKMLKVRKEDLIEPRVLVPCIIMFLAVFAYGTVFTVLPDLGESVGIRNKGILFTFLTVSSLAVRLLAGKASDYYGRRAVLRVSTLVIVVAMLIIGWGNTPRDLMIGITIYGMAHGMTSPTLLAWATDLSLESNKGRGIASLYIFMELGIGVGAFASGLIYHNDPANFFITFVTCSVMSGIAFLYLVFSKSPVKVVS
ncbi:MAG: MFS transporter [Bacteroidia bacterium]|nr:MFS transporter [Bacteroidia bacterium]